MVRFYWNILDVWERSHSNSYLQVKAFCNYISSINVFVAFAHLESRPEITQKLNAQEYYVVKKIY